MELSHSFQTHGVLVYQQVVEAGLLLLVLVAMLIKSDFFMPLFVWQKQAHESLPSSHFAADEN